MAAARGASSGAGQWLGASVEDLPAVCAVDIEASARFLAALALPAGCYLYLTIYARRKYGADKNAQLHSQLLLHTDCVTTARLMHGIMAGVTGHRSDTVMYLHPTPRNAANANRHAVKLALDDDTRWQLVHTIAQHAAAKPENRVNDKTLRVTDIDVDQPEAVPMVRDLLRRLGIPLLAEVTTRGGAHFLFRPQLPSKDTHGHLVLSLEAIRCMPQFQDKAEVVSMKNDRGCPVPGSMQGGTRVTAAYPPPAQDGAECDEPAAAVSNPSRAAT